MSRSTGTSIVVLAVLLAGCAGADDGAQPAGVASSRSPTPASATATRSADAATNDASDAATADDTASAASEATADGPVVATSDSDYGTVLVDGRRQAIYLFDRETGRTPRCYGACAAAWPPVLASADPRARRQARAALLDTVQRRDGTVQVTYAGHPLYFYAHEEPGELLCHDIVEYGGRWLAVTPRGVAAPT